MIDMQALTEKEVKLLVRSNIQVSNLRLVRTTYQQKPKFHLEFTLHTHDSHQESTLINSRNKQRNWSDVMRAMAYVENLFPDVSDIKLILNGA